MADFHKIEKLHVVVVGGSIAGLMHGIMLKDLGHRVQILEQNVASPQSDYAAGISTGPNGRAFFEAFDRHKYPLGFDSPGFQFLRPDDSISKELALPLMLTGWTVLYHRLRGMYDELHASHSSKSQHASSLVFSTRSEHFQLGRKVTGVRIAENQAAIEYEDVWPDQSTHADNGRTIYADLVIDASGSNSTIRQSFFPNLEKPYAGYVGWRGTVPETDVSESCRTLFTREPRLNYLPTETGYIMGYVVPGATGQLEPGKRRINYVWYDTVAERSQFFTQAMTDCHGNIHRNTLPKGAMAPEIHRIQKARAKGLLSPAFFELVSATKEPFISTVRDCYTPSLCLLGGRLVLVGESASMIRPHAGSAIEQCATQCLLMRKALRGLISFQDWEEGVKKARTQARLFSRSIGDYYLASRPRFLISLAAYIMFLIWQKLTLPWNRAKLGSG